MVVTTTSRSRLYAWTLLGLIAFGGEGCAYSVRLLSQPEGASVLLPDGSGTVTPGQARFRYRAGGHQIVRVEAEGYRPLVVDMQRTEGPILRYIGGAIFQKGGREVTFVLEPDRPPVGTAEPSAPPAP